MTVRDEFLVWINTAWHDAERALHNGEAGPRRALWSRNEPVSVLGAWRSANGQQELDELITSLGKSFSDCTSYDFDLLACDVVGDMAYTAGFEHTKASVDGEPRAYTLRATQAPDRALAEGGTAIDAARSSRAIRDIVTAVREDRGRWPGPPQPPQRTRTRR
jgi:hypothetical protein